MPGAREVLTEIFKSCAHSEQMLSLTPAKPIKVSDIYLSKEQINSQTPGNLLQLFFTNVRPPKKVLEDQLTQVAARPAVPVLASAAPWADPEDPLSLCCPQILRKYGVPKPKFDKSKYGKGGKEQHPVKVVCTKRPVTKPPAKDKAVLSSVRCASGALGVGRAGHPGPPPPRLAAKLSVPLGADPWLLFAALSFGSLASSTERERFILSTSIVKSGPHRQTEVDWCEVINQPKCTELFFLKKSDFF